VDPAFAYLDDVLIASTPEGHVSAVRAVLEKLKESGLVLNLEKCEFGKSEVNFLGHKISAAGVEPLVSCA
jgi:Reverse transcriptase (RNA-dependent DNA polymerase)